MPEAPLPNGRLCFYNQKMPADIAKHPWVRTTHLHEWCFTPFLASPWAERFTEHISQHTPPTFLPLYLTQLQTLTVLGWWGGGKVTGSEEIQKRSPLIFLAQWGQETVCFTCCHSLTPNSTEIMIDTLYLLNKYVNKWGNKWTSERMGWCSYLWWILQALADLTTLDQSFLNTPPNSPTAVPSSSARRVIKSRPSAMWTFIRSLWEKPNHWVATSNIEGSISTAWMQDFGKWSWIKRGRLPPPRPTTNSASGVSVIKNKSIMLPSAHCKVLHQP